MKVFYLDKKEEKKFNNLGAKITQQKFDSLLNSGISVMIRDIKGELQMDFRIRKVVTDFKKNTFHFVFTAEFGKIGFDTYTPRPKTSREIKKFGSLRELMEFLDKSYNIKERDWLIK